jgi:Ni,Fe-hydrogenase III small subunit
VAVVVPVDLFIPGCPPHPLTILDGLLCALDRLKQVRFEVLPLACRLSSVVE